MSWIYILSGALALALFIYLLIALFKPELF
jgi:K+-transporting ATPase KdpF subunit